MCEMDVHRIAADILKATQYILRYAVDGCEVYPLMRWMIGKK